MKRKVLIIEPSEIIVDGIKQALQHPDVRLLEPEASLADARERVVAMRRDDVVIVNPTLVKGAEAVRGDYHVTAVALVYQYVRQSALKGYDGIIDIRDSRASVLRTVLDACRQNGENDNEDTRGVTHELTRRETEILVEVARGLTNKEIASKFNVSIFTVTSHRKNIMRKTGIKSVAGLTVYALLNNLLDDR